MKKISINSNGLKIIAMITMFLDHFGYVCFPEYPIFRILGRLAFPIYAYLIAEGYQYTHDKKKYAMKLFLMGILYSIIFTVLIKQLYVSVLITFCFSIVAMTVYDKLIENPSFLKDMLICVIVAVICSISYIFMADYAIAGVLIPLLVHTGKDKKQKTALFAVGTLIAFLTSFSPRQLFGVTTVILIWLYNGEKGKYNLKHFFWWYYPAHIIVIWAISQII